MNVSLHKTFLKSYAKLPNKIQKHVDERLVLFRHDPFNSLLNNHALTGKYLGYRSINITGDFRAVYKLLADNLSLMVKVDTHSNLYK